MKIKSFPLFVASSILICSHLHAGVVTWDKGDTTLNWGDASNWDSDVVPLATDDVVFTATGLANSNVIVLGVNRTINSLSLNHTTTPFSLDSTTTQTLNLVGANGSGFNLQKQQGSTDTINANITLGDAAVTGGTTDLTWNNSNIGGGVTINGTIGKANPGQTVNLTKNGTGLVTVSTAAVGGVSHNASLVSLGILRFNAGAALNSSFGTGAITIDGGTFSYQGPEIAINATTGLPTGNDGADRSLLTTIVADGAGGTLNMNQGSGNNGSAVAYDTMSLGAPLVFTSNAGGNGDGYTLAGTVTLQQDAVRTLRLTNATIHNSIDWLSGKITDGAGGTGNALHIAVTGRTLQLTNSSNDYAGGTTIEASGVIYYSYLDVFSAATLGTGNLTMESGGRIRLGNPTATGIAGNLASAATITAVPGSVVGVNGADSIADRFTAASEGVYGIEGATRTYALDMSTLGNGKMFLGTVTGGTYDGALTAGLGSTYRLGGGSSSGTLSGSSSTGASNVLTLSGANMLTGLNNLVVGSGLNTNASAGRVVISASQDFSGTITVNSDGMLTTSMTGGTPFGNTANPIEVFGQIAASGAGGTFDATSYSNVSYFPGSTLVFNNDKFNNATGGNNNDRWPDAQAITLNGSSIALQGARSSDTSEVLGAVTYKGNARLSLLRAANGAQDVQLTVASLTRSGLGTLAVVSPANYTAKLGSDGANDTNNRLVNIATPPLLNSNTMVAPNMIAYDIDGNNNASKGTFLTYSPATGTIVLGPLGYKSAIFSTTNLNAAVSTDIVNAGATTLSTNPSVYALRMSGAIAAATTNTTITIGSGSDPAGLIDEANNVTHSAIFDFGAREAVLWKITGNPSTFTGGIKTTGGLTKSGASQITLSGASALNMSISGGITINQGTVAIGSSTSATDMNDNLMTVNQEGTFNLGNNNVTVLGLAGVGKGGNIINSGGGARILTIDLASGTQSYDGRLQGTGTPANLSLIKDGLGTEEFSIRSVASHTGTTQVTAGTLLVNGNFAAASGAVTVDSGAILGGIGTLGGAVTVTGIIAPGASIGTLNVVNNVNWVGAATAGTATDWRFELGAANTADKLAITGDFLKDTTLGSAFRFDFQGSTATGTFVLAEWTGSTTFTSGDFSGINLGGGHTATFAIVDKQLQATVVGGGATPYDTWANQTFAKPFTNTGAEVDFDNDGIKNLLEFVFGGDPTISQPNVLPAVTSASGSDLVITFNRSDASELQPVTVKVQVSDDLATWNPADDITIGAVNGSGPNGASYTVTNSAGMDTIVVTIPKAAATKKFTRIIATQ